MSWTFSYNITPKPYITSDNPVVIADDDFNYGNNALISNKKKIIQYPDHLDRGSSLYKKRASDQYDQRLSVLIYQYFLHS